MKYTFYFKILKPLGNVKQISPGISRKNALGPQMRETGSRSLGLNSKNLQNQLL